MAFFDVPTSFRVRDTIAALTGPQRRHHSLVQMPVALTAANATLDVAMDMLSKKNHGSHPNFLNLAGLVSEAVLEVVFVALPGFMAAYCGMFDANSQKFVAELNTMVFTPCLIFTKLASQLNAEKLADLVIIPVIFVVTTFVSWIAAQSMAWAWGFSHKKRQKNFILAMGVFGNSNSLPISLVLSLSKTIQGLHWDKVPGDNDDEVAARGILYLLIFQQLGQLLRWTWGYSVLLKPAAAYEEDERLDNAEDDRWTEEGRYRDDPDDDAGSPTANGKPKTTDSGFGSGPPSTLGSSSASMTSESDDDQDIVATTPTNGNRLQPPHTASLDRARSLGHITTFPNFGSSPSSPADEQKQGWKASVRRFTASLRAFPAYLLQSIRDFYLYKIHNHLPKAFQTALEKVTSWTCSFLAGVRRQMNPPLWAMLVSLIVASIPEAQHVFFTQGTFVNNSITRAVEQTGGVAVPLILVVLGANLARSTLPQDQLATSAEEKSEERKLLYASLMSRMLIPTIIMAPILALTAKYVTISILDDPIFIIVCFLLTGAPSALQLAQICQINNVFMGAMSSLLTASYVVAIFPSTLGLVMCALEVLEWAKVGRT
ncbi:Hypothetical protein R9X50_00629600 [Acrodontium crateriforme]|uniref:Auxin efflux carrier n=1 Tax=Acrodontium crateriforme TaxID=150365 RepID=A0AAQ3MBB0_9PEZI|nr:Hypothetical protein R9X50_00629600 [Acrodontium crateriforme]